MRWSDEYVAGNDFLMYAARAFEASMSNAFGEETRWTVSGATVSGLVTETLCQREVKGRPSKSSQKSTGVGSVLQDTTVPASGAASRPASKAASRPASKPVSAPVSRDPVS